jgi:hypothetical protein
VAITVVVLVRVKLHSDQSCLLIKELSVLCPTIKRAQAAVRIKRSKQSATEKMATG